MVTAQPNGVWAPSEPYLIVRCRQLEGTYSGDPQPGCWPITAQRIERGWGWVPESAWPNNALESWPPQEPPGVDDLAKANRIFRYQRVRTAQECLDALRSRHVVMGAFEITREWFDAVDGVIPIPAENAPVIASHQVTIVGSDQRFLVMPGNEKTRFVFHNSWGMGWGVDGYGFLPSEFFAQSLIEAWTFDLASPGLEGQGEAYFTLPGIVSPVQYVAEINDAVQDIRLAWTMVTHRQDFLDVEDLFVRPTARRKGYGTKLLKSLCELSRRVGLPLRFLIPFADGDRDNLALVQRMLQKIHYRIELSGVRWAPYVGILSTSLEVQPHFPEKPTCARPTPLTGDELERRKREKNGVFEADFQRAADRVFNEHEELLRRLA